MEKSDNNDVQKEDRNQEIHKLHRTHKKRITSKVHIPHLPDFIYRNLVKVIMIVVICLAIVGFIAIRAKLHKSKERTTIVSTSSLERILQISDLSTYKAVYNGVADVKNTKGDKVLYHVSYESEVKVGFDTDEIQINVDQENKKVIITLPEIKINDVTVKMESLDYIFEDNSANTSNVSKEAYQACIEDVKSESASNDQIYELARDNSVNLMRALIEPLLTQSKENYTLEIN